MGANGFAMTKGEDRLKDVTKTGQAEWMMPNLANLPIRAAIEQLSGHTTRIRVYGNGYVTDQSPKAFERLTGEQECIVHGRAEDE